MATWWKRHFGSLSRSDEPDGEETVSRKESVTMPYGAGKKTVVETKKTDEKEPLFNISYGTPQSLPVSQIPEFDDVLSPKRGDPQLTVNNLLSTVPTQPLGAGYYKPIKDTPAITGYTTGQSGVNIPIFDAPGNIFPMGLWDERRRSLLNAYSISQSSQPSVDMWNAPEVHVHAQNMVNQSWVEDAKKLYSQAYAAGKVKDLKRPGTEYGDRYIAMVNNYKTIAATINRAVAYAETVLDPKNMAAYNPFQRMLATKLVNGDVSDVKEYALISKVLYQMPDYDKRMQDTAKSLMEYAEQPPTDEDKKYIMDKFGYTSQDLTEFIKTPNGGNLVRFMMSMKKIEDGTYDNIASRLGHDYQDKYMIENEMDRKLTPQEWTDMAKNDLKEYLRTKYNVSSNVLQAPARTNVNIGAKESDESYVGAYVTSYRQNKQEFDDMLGSAADAMSKGNFQSAKDAFKTMNSFTDKKGRKLFHFIPNQTDNENSVIKWKAAGELTPLKTGDKRVISLKKIHDDLIRMNRISDAKKVEDQIKLHGENAGVEFIVSSVDGVLLEPYLNKPITYAALSNIKRRNNRNTGGQGGDEESISVIQPGWAFSLSAFKPTVAEQESDEKKRKKIDLSGIDYTLYENLEYSPGQLGSETSISSGQRSWEIIK